MTTLQPRKDAGSLIADRYRLEDDTPLGTGGMGEVWRATDEQLGCVVALKKVRLTGLDERTAAVVAQRTLHEGHIASRLQHPNIVTITDVITEAEQLWLVLQYVPSRSADTLLAAQGPFPLHLAAQTGAQIAEALHTAHTEGVLHRDVTPGNVLIDNDWNAKLTDFGIARAAIDLQRTTDTSSIGTPAYMAPETAKGEHPTTATDIYGLGATIYTLVEGTPPFHQPGQDNPLRLFHQIATSPMPAAANAGPLTAVLTSMTNPDPARRPDAAKARDMFVTAAREIATHPPTPAAPEQAAPMQAAQHPTGAVPPAPAVPLPTIPAPTMAAPTTVAPTVPVPAVPAPTSAVPTVPTPTVAAPTVAVQPWSVPIRTSAASEPRPGTQVWWRRPFVLPTALVLLIVAVLGAILLIPVMMRHLEAAPPPPSSDKYLPRPALADPCVLAKAPDYALFGTVSDHPGSWFSSCDADLILAGGGTADVEFRMFVPQSVDGPTDQRGDLTVISPPGTNATQCYRDVVLPDRNIIVARTTVASSNLDACVLSGMGVDAVVQQLHSTGTFPTVPDLGAANSLRRQNACKVLSGAELAEVPGLDTSQTYPQFGGWACYWGVNLATMSNSGAPWVDVYFERENPMVAGPDGTPRTIAGRTVFLKNQSITNGQDCIAQIVHRRETSATDAPPEESANIEVSAPVPAAQQCQLAADLAAKLIPHLPPAN